MSGTELVMRDRAVRSVHTKKVFCAMQALCAYSAHRFRAIRDDHLGRRSLRSRTNQNEDQEDQASHNARRSSLGVVARAVARGVPPRGMRRMRATRVTPASTRRAWELGAGPPRVGCR